jgi:16S rRNA processing protein RimM
MRVIVGRIGRPHGIRGEVVVGVRTDEPDLRFAVGAVLDAERTLAPDTGVRAGQQAGSAGARQAGSAGARQASAGAGRTESAGARQAEPAGDQLTVASARWHSGQLLIGFAGITDRTSAGELTGSWLTVDTSQLPGSADPDEFRDHELIGMSVRTVAGDAVGVVTDVLHYGQDLLVIRRDQPGNPARNGASEAMVPFVKAIVPDVDVKAGVIVIDPPPGLIDPAESDEAQADEAQADEAQPGEP